MSDRDIVLEEGIVLSLTDRSNRYYGDFHRVCLDVSVSFDRNIIAAAGYQGDLPDENLIYSATLERMGVATKDLASVRDDLVTSFCSTARGYLTRPAFVSGLLKRKAELDD